VRHRARGSMARSVRRSGGRRLLPARAVGSAVVTAAALAPGAVAGRLLGASGSAAHTGPGRTGPSRPVRKATAI
jgi:hypothetical protein